MSGTRKGAVFRAAQDLRNTGSTPRLVGSGANRAVLGDCVCGGQVEFDTDDIGRSIMRCAKCNKVQWLGGSVNA